MNCQRIEEIQKKTAYPDSVSVHQALLQVWSECSRDAEVLREEGRKEIRQLVTEFRDELWRQAQRQILTDESPDVTPEKPNHIAERVVDRVLKCIR